MEKGRKLSKQSILGKHPSATCIKQWPGLLDNIQGCKDTMHRLEGNYIPYWV